MGDVLGEYIAICATPLMLPSWATWIGVCCRRRSALFPQLRSCFSFEFTCEEDMLIFLAARIETPEYWSRVRNAASGRIAVAIDNLACRASLRVGD